jgi:FkbM family methyltransferase
MKLIQIGANNGKDQVFDFINQNKSDLEVAILIEPIPFIIDDLKKQYEGIDKVIIENIAITNESDKESMTLYYLKDSNYEVSSFSEHHTTRHSPSLIEYPVTSMEVPCMSVNKLMEKYNLDSLDYLFIDTEGLDVFIICSLDFEKYSFKNIIFEAIHSDGPFQTGENLNKSVHYLESLGYNITQFDAICLKASK